MISLASFRFLHCGAVATVQVQMMIIKVHQHCIDD